jgi:hypothetical protein
VTHEPGEGHAKNATSKDAMAKWDVTEKDLPPNLIISLGEAAGLRLKRLLPNPVLVERVAFAPNWIPKSAKEFSARFFELVAFSRAIFLGERRSTAIVVMEKP